MRPHHEKAIEKLTESLKKKKKYLALIITGSVAKGLENENSDIDIVLLVTEEEYMKRKNRRRLNYVSTSFCDWPGGYFDGKIVSLSYLKLVAERGNEVTRALFEKAWVAFSKIPELEDVLQKIPVYQKDEKMEKIQKFYAQFEYNKWFTEEALKREDRYALIRGVADLILFGGRLILAHNEILFPYHKLFMITLEEAPEKPEALMELIEKLLNEPNQKNIQSFYDAIKDFRNWNISEAWPNRFMIDTELAWIDDKAFIGDL